MRWILNVEAPSILSGFPNLASLVVVWNPFQSSQVTENNQRKFSTVSDYPKIMVICIPASLLRGFEEALLAAVPEPSYLLMPTIATRCWQHVEDSSNRRYYQNKCWCRWDQIMKMISDDDHFIVWTLNSHKRLRMALMGVLPRRWARAIIESRFFFNLVDLVGCSWWWGSNICWWHRPFFARRLLVVFNTISLAWITKRRLEFPGTKSPSPLSPQLQREISS